MLGVILPGGRCISQYNHPGRNEQVIAKIIGSGWKIYYAPALTTDVGRCRIEGRHIIVDVIGYTAIIQYVGYIAPIDVVRPRILALTVIGSNGVAGAWWSARRLENKVIQVSHAAATCTDQVQVVDSSGPAYGRALQLVA